MAGAEAGIIRFGTFLIFRLQIKIEIYLQAFTLHICHPME